MIKAMEAGKDYLAEWCSHHAKRKNYHEGKLRDAKDLPYSTRAMASELYHGTWSRIHGNINYWLLPPRNRRMLKTLGEVPQATEEDNRFWERFRRFHEENPLCFASEEEIRYLAESGLTDEDNANLRRIEEDRRSE